jgi:LmbE family N-acetylglucosaminyl deacetylase
VVVAHADDEVLGCGGTIAKHVAKGDTVCAVFLADGVTSRPDASDKELAERNLAAKKAHSILGIKQSFMLGLPDNRMDTVPLIDIVQKLECIIHELQPHIVYTHHYGDLNIDHRITHKAVMTACRPIPDLSVKEIYTFEVLSSTEWNSPGLNSFTPSVFVDITDYLDVKVQALSAYKLEMRDPPHSRSLENCRRLAMFRGNSIGVIAAEAMMVIRVIL